MLNRNSEKEWLQNALVLMAVAWFCNHSSWFVLQNEDTAVFVTLNAPIRQYEDETFLLIWIQHLFWFYHLLVQTEAWWLFVVFICSMLFLSVYWNYFNNMSVLQVTTVFATKLKSFTFVPLLKRLPVENRVWKKVLQTGRPNKVILLRWLGMVPVNVCHIVSLKKEETNMTLLGIS